MVDRLSPAILIQAIEPELAFAARRGFRELLGREAFPGFDPVQSDLIAADGIEELVEAAKKDGLSCLGTS
jgi:hypothetical protein